MRDIVPNCGLIGYDDVFYDAIVVRIAKVISVAKGGHTFWVIELSWPMAGRSVADHT